MPDGSFFLPSGLNGNFNLNGGDLYANEITDRVGAGNLNLNGGVLHAGASPLNPWIHDINGGVYVVNRERFFNNHLPEKFSFEKDYLEAFVREKVFFGKAFQDYFIDIGIPQDYQQAQTDFKTIFS